MVRRKNRLTTDAVREVKNTFSRFLSILVLSALAVAFLAGLRATAPDMEYTADNYYDRTHLMDGYVLSTLGITEDDLAALRGADGVEAVEGGYDLDAISEDSIVTVRSMPQELDLPEVKRGRLPERADECVTEERLLLSLGLELGDRLELELEDDDADSLKRASFTIVGTVTSPLYVSTDRGTSSLGNGSVDAFVYIPGENFDMDVYTVAYFTGTGLAELDSYGDEYEDRMEALVDSLDGLAEERAELRWQSVVGEAQDKLDDAQRELDDARAETDQELGDAWQELQDARQELDEGWAEYEDGTDALERELRNARAQLNDAAEQLRQAEQDYEDGLAEYQDGKEEYDAWLSQYEAGEAEYAGGLAEYEEQLAEYEAAKQAGLLTEEQQTASEAQLAEAKAALDAVRQDLDEAKAELDAAAAQLAEAEAELEAGKQAIEDGWTEYNDGWAELRRQESEGRQELADALVELQDGEAEYADGLEEYEDGKAEADEKLAEAEQELADAQAEVDKIEECKWYVLGRNTNSGVVSYSQDAERVGNLAKVFPIIFFLVAALACLTTMTRMVEEQRTQIGSLKAMGFSRFAISKKYIGYAFFASLVGGVVGLAVGCTVIPAVIANAFNIMYAIPKLRFRSQTLLCVLAVLAAVACTTGAALWACLSTLIDSPANLMRPKAPKAGKRVFLERIGPIWRRLSFTWKVTMRNLFRYQRRFWMTVIGIGGCTALIVTGFGLHESIFAILDKQFDEISRYDATVGLDEDITQEQRDTVEDYLAGSEAVERYLPCYQSAVEASTGALAHDAYVFAADAEGTFQEFIDLRHRKDDEQVTLSGDGAVITEKLAELLDVEPGDVIILDGDERVEVPVVDIVENYVYHYVYLDDSLYEQLYGRPVEENVVLLALREGVGEEESDQVSRELMKLDGVVSYSYIATIRDSFTDSMSAIDYAVVIIILSAAALAFVVLYNLTNINITERTRELATLKVLGFYDKEITAYVYRENIFLTLFGVLLGLVLGRFLHGWLVLTVEVDLVMFGRTAPAYAYVLAAALTALFSVVVNIAAHFRLKKVDMVESLKTVE